MDDERIDSWIAESLSALAPRTKQPASAKLLNTWIAQTEQKLGDDTKGGRLGWLVASSIAIAAVQRALDQDGKRLFLLKGGTLIQHRLQAIGRPTKDIDGLVRGDLDRFLRVLEDVLAEPWGPFTLRRGAVNIINTPAKVIKPRAFDIYLDLRGTTWRRVRFEISPDEANIGDEWEAIQPPPLSHFGLPNPGAIVGITMRFQIAQKLHAVSDPHNPPESVNDRARDVVDLLLLRDLLATTDSPTLADVRAASVAVFTARAAEATKLGRPTRAWPPTVRALTHWGEDFTRAAESGNVSLSLDEAVDALNHWIAEIDSHVL